MTLYKLVNLCDSVGGGGDGDSVGGGGDSVGGVGLGSGDIEVWC